MESENGHLKLEIPFAKLEEFVHKMVCHWGLRYPLGGGLGTNCHESILGIRRPTPKVVDRPPFCGAFWPQKSSFIHFWHQWMLFDQQWVIVGRHHFRQLSSQQTTSDSWPDRMASSESYNQHHTDDGWNLATRLILIGMVFSHLYEGLNIPGGAGF